MVRSSSVSGATMWRKEKWVRKTLAFMLVDTTERDPRSRYEHKYDMS